MASIIINGLYDSYAAAAQAVRELTDFGIPADDINFMATPTDETADLRPVEDSDAMRGAGEGAGTGAGAGTVVGGLGGLLAGLGVLAIPGLGPVVAAGWLAATAAGALAGAVAGGATGGIIGALTSAGVKDEDAHVYAEGVRRGGTLVTVRVPEHMAGSAEAIMERHGRIDLATRTRLYRDDGWTRFDETASPPGEPGPDHDVSGRDVSGRDNSGRPIR